MLEKENSLKDSDSEETICKTKNFFPISRGFPSQPYYLQQFQYTESQLLQVPSIGDFSSKSIDAIDHKRERSKRNIIDEQTNPNPVNKGNNWQRPLHLFQDKVRMLAMRNPSSAMIKQRLNYNGEDSQITPSLHAQSMMRKVYNKIRIQVLSKLFMDNMLGLIHKTRWSQFSQNKELFQLLNDKTAFFSIKDDNYGTKSTQNKIITQKTSISTQSSSHIVSSFQSITQCVKLRSIQIDFLRLIEQIPLFSPFSQFLMIWDYLQLICLAFIFIVIPIHISFNKSIQDLEGSNSIFIVLIGILFLDIAFKFNTSLFSQGKEIKFRPLIAAAYLKDGLVGDVITLLSIILFILMDSLNSNIAAKSFRNIIILVFLKRYQQFGKVLRKIEIQYHFSPQISQILRLAILFLMNIYIIHLLACFWIYIARTQGKQSDQSRQTWLQKQNLEDEKWYIQFLNSFYFNTVTMVTVGYGDISPQTTIERFCSILTVLSACGVFAYSISEVGSIFQEMNEEQKRLKANMFVINNYMKKKKITSDLQYQVRHYLEYYWHESLSENTAIEQNILNQLSNNLKENLLIEANRLLVLESPFFRDNFSLKTILKTVSIVTEQRCTPEEIIYLEGDTDDSSIYFIEKGSVLFFHSTSVNNRETLSLNSLKQGAYFGEMEFLTGQQRLQSLRSLEFTTLIKIERAKFLEVIAECPQDYEKFCSIRDEIVINQNMNYIKRRCRYCSQAHNSSDSAHFEDDCPLVRFIPNKQKLEDQFRFQPSVQDRGQRDREQTKFNSIGRIEQVQGDQDQINFNLKQIIRTYINQNGLYDIYPTDRQENQEFHHNINFDGESSDEQNQQYYKHHQNKYGYASSSSSSSSNSDSSSSSSQTSSISPEIASIEKGMIKSSKLPLSSEKRRTSSRSQSKKFRKISMKKSSSKMDFYQQKPDIYINLNSPIDEEITQQDSTTRSLTPHIEASTPQGLIQDKNQQKFTFPSQKINSEITEKDVKLEFIEKKQEYPMKLPLPLQSSAHEQPTTYRSSHKGTDTEQIDKKDLFIESSTSFSSNEANDKIESSFQDDRKAQETNGILQFGSNFSNGSISSTSLVKSRNNIERKEITSIGQVETYQNGSNTKNNIGNNQELLEVTNGKRHYYSQKSKNKLDEQSNLTNNQTIEGHKLGGLQDKNVHNKVTSQTNSLGLQKNNFLKKQTSLPLEQQNLNFLTINHAHQSRKSVMNTNTSRKSMLLSTPSLLKISGNSSRNSLKFSSEKRSNRPSFMTTSVSKKNQFNKDEEDKHHSSQALVNHLENIIQNFQKVSENFLNQSRDHNKIGEKLQHYQYNEDTSQNVFDEFERMKCFDIYFPHNNYTNVLVEASGVTNNKKNLRSRWKIKKEVNNKIKKSITMQQQQQLIQFQNDNNVNVGGGLSEIFQQNSLNRLKYLRNSKVRESTFSDQLITENSEYPFIRKDSFSEKVLNKKSSQNDNSPQSRIFDTEESTKNGIKFIRQKSTSINKFHSPNPSTGHQLLIPNYFGSEDNNTQNENQINHPQSTKSKFFSRFSKQATQIQSNQEEDAEQQEQQSSSKSSSPWQSDKTNQQSDSNS